MQMPPSPGTGAALALGAGTAGAWLAAGVAGTGHFSASPCSHHPGTVCTHSVLALMGPGCISPLAGGNAGFRVADFPSAFLKVGVRGAEQLGFLPRWEGRAELGTGTGVMCVSER